MYLTKIIQGLEAVARVCCYVLSDGVRAPSLSIKIVQGLVAGVLVCCCVLCVGGRALGVSDQDYPRAGGWCACVLLCIE